MPCADPGAGAALNSQCSTGQLLIGYSLGFASPPQDTREHVPGSDPDEGPQAGGERSEPLLPHSLENKMADTFTFSPLEELFGKCSHSGTPCLGTQPSRDPA